MRVIAGKHKGKVLYSPKSDEIRPTLDIVKQAFFTKFQFEMAGKSFLDLFGGSGAMGIEALSRGAGLVTIVDNSPKSIELIKKNVELVQEQAQVVFCDYKKFLKTNHKEYDYIFLDPPYEHIKAYENAMRLIKENTQLTLSGIVVCEHSFEHKMNFDGFELISQKKYGTVMLSFFKQLR